MLVVFPPIAGNIAEPPGSKEVSLELAEALPVMLAVEKFGNEADDAIEMDAPILAALLWAAPSCDEEEEEDDDDDDAFS